jgi:hypothetical protein
MKFISVVVVAVILGIAGLAYAQDGQVQKKKSAKQSHAMVKKDECCKMKTHGSMECCRSDSTKSAPEK